MNTGKDIERDDKDLIPYDQIRSEFEQKRYIVLEKGTKFDLELEYSTPEEEFKPLKVGQTRTFHPQERDILIRRDLELKEDTPVGEYILFVYGEEGNLYKFPLINSEILDLEEESREYEMDLIRSFNIPYDAYETPYPERIGDIDMSLFRHYHPHAATLLEEKAKENPYREKIVEEQKRLNRQFVKEYLGENVKIEGLESVRIVTRL